MKKHLGQHFLHDPNIINQIINLISPKEGERLIEIGPGEGALTVKLLPLVNNLHVIEIDQDLVPVLEKKCAYSPKLHIHLADVLKVDFSQFTGPLRLVGNLPYNISTPLLFYLIKNIEKIEDMHFMLQKEVAERIIASPGSKIYGRLSVKVQYYCEPKLLLHIGQGAFSPPPKVESSFIKLVPRNNRSIVATNTRNFQEIVRSAFNQRRKVISNGLKKYITAKQLAALNIDPKLRPEQLAVNDFVRICNSIDFITDLS